jgi:hypothetical protein
MLNIGFLAASTGDCPSMPARPVQPPVPEKGIATTGDTARTPGVARSAASSRSMSVSCLSIVSYSS